MVVRVAPGISELVRYSLNQWALTLFGGIEGRGATLGVLTV